MFSRIINQQIYDFFQKSFLVDFKDFFTKFCLGSCTLSKPCRKTKFREKIQVKTDTNSITVYFFYTKFQLPDRWKRN